MSTQSLHTPALTGPSSRTYRAARAWRACLAGVLAVLVGACQSAPPPPPPATAVPAVTSPAATAAPAPAPAVSPVPAASPAARPAASPSPSPAATGPRRGGTLTLVQPGQPTSFDPHRAGDPASQRVLDLVYSRLTMLGPDLGVQPDLAESWTVASGGKTVTFRLREAKFHNGDPVTSGDVKYSLERVLNPDTVAIARPLFADVEKIDTPDARTVVLTLKQPNVAVLAYLADPGAAIVSRKVAEAAGNNLSGRATAIGSGPFRLAASGTETSLRLDAVRDFYVSGQPYLDGVRIDSVPDETSVLTALRARAADLAVVRDARTAQSLKTEPGVTLSTRPGLDVNVVYVNTQRAALTDPKVRQALSYAVDRQQVVAAAASGVGEVTGPISPALQQYAVPVADYPTYRRDVNRARQLLREAGTSTLEVGLMTPASDPPQARAIAQALQRQLAEAGVEARIEQVESGEYARRWLHADFDLAVGLNQGQPDPDTYLYRYFAADGDLGFVTSYDDGRVATAVQQARATSDVRERQRLYDAAQRNLAEGTPFLWLYAGHSYAALLPGTKGFVHLPTGSIVHLRQTWLER